MAQFFTQCGTGSLATTVPADTSTVKVYDDYATACACIACIAEGEIVSTKSDHLLDMDAVECMMDEKLSYSTSEVVTGGTWIDDCPIYRKVINSGALPNAATKRVNTGATCVKDIISIQGIAYNATSAITLPFVTAAGTGNVNINYNYNCNAIEILACNDRSGYTNSCIIMEYTRTE